MAPRSISEKGRKAKNANLVDFIFVLSKPVSSGYKKSNHLTL